LEDAEREEEGGFVPGNVSEAVELGGYSWYSCANNSSVLDYMLVNASSRGRRWFTRATKKKTRNRATIVGRTTFFGGYVLTWSVVSEE
jgi:hypothetical protein